MGCLHVVICLCLSLAAAHITPPLRGTAQTPIHLDIHEHSGTSVHTAPRTGGVVHFLGAEAREGSNDGKPLPRNSRDHCFYMACCVFLFCCCGKGFVEAMGEQAASQFMCFMSVFMFVYLLHSGIYSAYWRGENVGTSCIIMCWWVLLLMIAFTCICCFLFCAVGTTLLIKNECVAAMKKDYDAKMLLISGPRRDYYESDFFRAKCERWFDEADADASGKLDMHELMEVIVRVTGNPDVVHVTPLLAEAFDQHGTSEVEKHEFVEMMKFVSVSGLHEGQFTLEQGYEILQLPETATKSEVSKAYRTMAIKYHPDKQTDKDPEVAKRDMAEINDAKQKVEEHLKLQDKGSKD